MKRIPPGVLLSLVSVLALIMIASVWLNGDVQDRQGVLRIGYHPNYGGASAVCIGIEKGFFQAYGLKVEPVCFASGPQSIAALEANEIDVSFLGHGATSFLQEGKAQIVGLDSLSYAEAILVRMNSGIDCVQDLAGKTVATPFATSGENFLDMVLQRAGMRREQLRIINYDVAGALSAFVAGKVDAVSIWAPYTEQAVRALGQDNVKVLADCRKMKEQMFLPMCWVSTEGWIDGHLDELKMFLSALYDSMDYRAEHLEETALLTAHFLDMPQDSLLGDIDTALWFTRPLAKKYVQSGDVLKWYQALDAFFITSRSVSYPTAVEKYLRMDVILQGLE